MARTSEDLKALIIAAKEYRETVEIEYMGEQFSVPIKPLTDAAMTDVGRKMKVQAGLLKSMISKVKIGEGLSESEMETATQEAVANMLSDSTEPLEVGEMEYLNFLTAQEFCKRGIADDQLRALVPDFSYGLTKKIANRIEVISNVPPAVVANFFGQTPEN